MKPTSRSHPLRCRVAAGLLLVFCIPLPAAEPTPVFLMERGVYEETALDDLRKAMSTYEKVRAHPAAGPRSRMEAAFRLAECHTALGHPLAAWIHFDEVTRSSQAPDDLAPLASEQKVMGLIELAENGTDYTPGLLHHVGDLVLTLEGALRHAERDRALKLLSSFEAALARLREETLNQPDRNLAESMQIDAANLRKHLAEGSLAEAHKSFTSRPYQRAFAGREALSGEDEVFGYALERLDEVVRALNAGQSVGAHERLRDLKRYLAPLHPWPVPGSHAEAEAYLNRLVTLTEEMENPILRNHLGTARLMVDAFLETHALQEMPHWHIDDATVESFINPEVLPHYGAASLLLDAMAKQLAENEIEAARELLLRARDRIKRLRQDKAGTSDEFEAGSFYDELTEMTKLLDRGDYRALQERFARRDQEAHSTTGSP